MRAGGNRTRRASRRRAVPASDRSRGMTAGAFFATYSSPPATYREPCSLCAECGRCQDLCCTHFGAEKCGCADPVCTGCTSTEIKDDCGVGAHRYQAALDAQRGRVLR